MCSENDRVVEVVDRVDDVDASLATLLSELIFGCTAAGAVNVELNKPKRPLPNAVDGIRAVRASNISLKLCGSVVDRISAVFKRVRESEDVKKTRETGLQLFQRLRAWQPQPQCVQAQLARAPGPVTLSSPEWSQQASSVFSSPSTQG